MNIEIRDAALEAENPRDSSERPAPEACRKSFSPA